MHNFDFLEKGLGIVSPTHFVYNFSGKNVSPVIFCYISLSDCLYLLRYWTICVLELFVSLVVTS